MEERPLEGHMYECPLPDHEMEVSIERLGPLQWTGVRCSKCHAGYLLEMTATPDGFTVSYYVFAANRQLDVSQPFKQWAVESCEAGISGMEQGGVNITRGVPTIGGAPPPILRMLTDWRPLDE